MEATSNFDDIKYLFDDDKFRIDLSGQESDLAGADKDSIGTFFSQSRKLFIKVFKISFFYRNG
jgi:hypothetical protein